MKVDVLCVEAAMVVAAYNLVSRFLLGTDVAGISDMNLPWPVDGRIGLGEVSPQYRLLFNFKLT